MDAPPRPSHKALAALYASATLASLALGPDGPRYWDSFGYVIQALRGRVGGLMLGRPAFVLASHGLTRAWLTVGGAVHHSEALLRTFWMLVSATAAPAMALVASSVGLSQRAACFAGLMLALSPSVAHTSRAVLTDAPSMALVLWAFALALRGARQHAVLWSFAAGALLGVAAGMREQALAHGLTLVALAAVAPTRRGTHGIAAVTGCALTFAAPVLWLAHSQSDYLASIARWVDAMRSERTQHPYGARDFGMFVVWALVSSPIAWALLGRGARRWKMMLFNDGRCAALVLPSFVQLAALAFYQDIAFSPRYLLGALPCAVVLPAAWMFNDARADAEAVRYTGSGSDQAARFGLVALLVLPVLVAAPIVRRLERPLRNELAALPDQLALLPTRSAVVTGQLCPAVVYERELAEFERRAPDIVQVCPGWRWPPNLAARLDELRAQGRTIAVDLRPASWIGERQLRCMRDAARYATAHAADEGLIVWR